MSKLAIARIRWADGISPKPAGYSTVALFESARDTYPAVAWSVVVQKIDRQLSQQEQIVEVRFLVANAPQELLAQGHRFELREGVRTVAYGEVISAGSS